LAGACDAFDGIGDGKKCSAHLLRMTDASDVAEPSKVKVDGRLILDDLPDAVFKAEKRSLLLG